ncbi:TraB/VirB10 family protein [Marinobacter salicampi]|uniref:TraB/VirB10 family protein n=1 Tax=Marinobacter salicampi TaxID=435907 RepID=UPI00140D0ABF|nr:TraB/VirB10 family protein [Marinobacter salicampi]
MKQYWENLDPKHKQWAVMGLSIIGLVFVVSLFVGEAEQKYGGRGNQEVVRNVLNERTSRDIGIDAMASRLRALEENLRNRSDELTETRSKLEETRNSVGVGKDVARQLASLKEEVSRIREEKQQTSKELETLQRDIKEGNLDMPRLQGDGQPKDTVNPIGTDDLVTNYADSTEPADRDTNSSFRSAPVPQFGDSRRNGGGGQGSSQGDQVSDAAPSRNLKMTTVSEAKTPEPSESSDDAEGKGTGIYIPSASLLSGTLMTGLDAPTGQGARRDPFPVVVRLQKDAILPNDYSADVKGCMAILSGFGDLSSERVYLRTEGISCIRNDGKSIEARLSGYAVGEDGKAGVRSRLVTKQGALVGRSMVAGFFGGVSQAFNVSPVPTINTTGNQQNVQYLDAFSDQAVQGGLVGGASNALEKVADFWLKMADSMFPVLEMDAGRQMDIVLVKGAELKLQ